jgi:hypothetical protein
MAQPTNRLIRITGFCVVLLYFFCAKPVRAQLIACSMPGTPEEFKVYLDDVRPLTKTVPPRLRARLDSLARSLQENLKVAVNGRAALKLCDKRFPLDVSEFTTQVDELDHMRVVLEIWGALGGANGDEGELGFVLVPARSLLNPVVFVAKDDFKGPMLELVKKYIELGAFVPVVLGTTFYQNDQFEDAISPLCEGETKLQVAIAKQGASQTPEQKAFVQHEKDLLVHVQTMVNVSLKKLKNAGKPQYKALTPDAGGNFSCPK